MPRTGVSVPRTAAGNRIGFSGPTNALSIPGIVANSAISIGTNVYNYERTQDFSICFWVFPLAFPSGASAGHIFTEYDASGPYRGRLIRCDSGGQFRFWLINNFATNELKGNYQPPPLAQWTRVVFTYDGSSTAAGIKCYFNNNLQTQTSSTQTLTSTIVSTSASTKWGNWGGAGNLGLPMYLAAPAILNYEMTAAQVADDYFKTVFSGTTPVDNWGFTEGSGTSVASTGTGGHTGTLGAAITWLTTSGPNKLRSSLSQARLPIS